MKTSHQTSAYIFVLALAIAGPIGTLSSGCASTRTSDSTGEFVDDTAITTKVKSALLKDDAVKSFEIRVETVKGVVQLSGFVDTDVQKSAASRDAYSISGVKDVSNNLILK
jgi:hyperosmotically inducible protein